MTPSSSSLLWLSADDGTAVDDDGTVDDVKSNGVAAGIASDVVAAVASKVQTNVAPAMAPVVDDMHVGIGHSWPRGRQQWQH